MLGRNESAGGLNEHDVSSWRMSRADIRTTMHTRFKRPMVFMPVVTKTSDGDCK